MTNGLNDVEALKKGYWAACDNKHSSPPVNYSEKCKREFIEGYHQAVMDFEIK